MILIIFFTFRPRPCTLYIHDMKLRSFTSMKLSTRFFRSLIKLANRNLRVCALTSILKLSAKNFQRFKILHKRIFAFLFIIDLLKLTYFLVISDCIDNILCVCNRKTFLNYFILLISHNLYIYRKPLFNEIVH